MKWYYKLITKGIRTKHYKDKSVEWNVPYYSKERYVFAPDEDTARNMIREKLKNKWTGFRLIRR